MISDNRLMPREQRQAEVRFRTPAQGPVSIDLEASRWRINERNFAYHNLEGRYVAGEVFFQRTDRLELDP